MEAGYAQICDINLTKITINPTSPGWERRCGLLKELPRDRSNCECQLSQNELIQIVIDICLVTHSLII